MKQSHNCAIGGISTAERSEYETMRILETVAGIILLGGAAWTTVRTYKGRGKSSWLILLFAMFLIALGLYFLVDAISGWIRDFRLGSEWIK